MEKYMSAIRGLQLTWILGEQSKFTLAKVDLQGNGSKFKK